MKIFNPLQEDRRVAGEEAKLVAYPIHPQKHEVSLSALSLIRVLSLSCAYRVFEVVSSLQALHLSEAGGYLASVVDRRLLQSQ